MKFTPQRRPRPRRARARRTTIEAARRRQRQGHRPEIPAARLRALPSGGTRRRRASTPGSGSASRSCATSSSCMAGRSTRERRRGQGQRRSPCACRSSRARPVAETESPAPARRETTSMPAAYPDLSRAPRPRRRRRAGHLRGRDALLGHCGADTRCASSAAAALEALETWNADMLVSDIGMPGEDGYMLLRSAPCPRSRAWRRDSRDRAHRVRTHRGPAAGPLRGVPDARREAGRRQRTGRGDRSGRRTQFRSVTPRPDIMRAGPLNGIGSRVALRAIGAGHRTERALHLSERPAFRGETSKRRAAR